MAQDLPIVCSLNVGDMEQRLAAIGEIGRKSLIDHQKTDGKHLLRFRPDPETREDLAAIVEAEKQCCAFLDLTLVEGCRDLTLAIGAPEAGQATAEGLAMAFATGAGLKPGSQSDPLPR
ncbi:MAG: hypothetical protein ABW196_10715 [Solirubrobacterales bacterium]